MKKRNKEDFQMTSINIEKKLYRDCKKQLLDDNISFSDLIINTVHMYVSGALNFHKFEFEISGSI